MIPFFPKPYPDEVLYSVIARYHVLSGNTIYRQTAQELFEDPAVNSSIVLPARLGTLAKQTRRFGESFDSLLMERTLYPYYTAFADNTNIEWVYDWAAEDKAGPMDCKLGLFGNKVSLPRYLRFCPKCFAEELECFGEGYWHRMHQTPGILVCEKHHIPLLETHIDYLAHDCNKYIPAITPALFPAVLPPTLSPKAYQQAVQIAEDVSFLYQNYGRIRRAVEKYDRNFQGVFLRLLIKRGLATTGGSLHLTKYRQEFLDYFSEEILNALGLAFDENTKRPWIVSLCRSRKQTGHPLRYILLARFLCGSFSEFLEVLEKEEPQRDKIHGEKRSQVADYEEKRNEYRKRWLDACDRLLGKCQNDIRKTAPSVYTWLFRHDKEWLQMNPKERLSRGGNLACFDWNAKDEYFSELVAKAADKIRSIPGKPVMITKTKLLNEIGCGRLPVNREKYLPRTMQAILLETETRELYRLRKIKWAEDELKKQGMPVVKWRVMKLAAIRDGAWDECWELYLSLQKAEATRTSA